MAELVGGREGGGRGGGEKNRSCSGADEEVGGRHLFVRVRAREDGRQQAEVALKDAPDLRRLKKDSRRFAPVRRAKEVFDVLMNGLVVELCGMGGCVM